MVAVAVLAVTAVVGAAVGDRGSEGLKTLATTGFADAYAAEIGGKAYDKTGGKPGAFTYAKTVFNGKAPAALAEAKTLLGAGEFLAPHFAVSADGNTITVMVAPHLLVDGAVVKGAGNDDSFIVVQARRKGGDNTFEAKRFDYSNKFE